MLQHLLNLFVKYIILLLTVPLAQLAEILLSTLWVWVQFLRTLQSLCVTYVYLIYIFTIHSLISKYLQIVLVEIMSAWNGTKNEGSIFGQEMHQFVVTRPFCPPCHTCLLTYSFVTCFPGCQFRGPDYCRLVFRIGSVKMESHTIII